MKPTEKDDTKQFRLSRRLQVTITVGFGGMVCEWDPRPALPMTVQEIAAYRVARDEMTRRHAEIVGGRVLTVEQMSGRTYIGEPMNNKSSQ
jgi:hypothetical protein